MADINNTKKNGI